MKRNDNEFKKYVQSIRRVMPYYNHGRRVIVLGENTKTGQDIIAKASRYEGTELRHVYVHCSEEKEQAFREVFGMFVNSRHGKSFSICSHTCQSFTVSWLSDDGLHFITSKTEYLVIFNE